MSYEDLFEEKFKIDEFVEDLCFDPERFYECVHDYSVILEEASQNTTKGNIFQKLWELIKKIMQMIRNGLVKFIRWIKKLIGIGSISAEQAAESVGIQPSKSVHPESKKKARQAKRPQRKADPNSSTPPPARGGKGQGPAENFQEFDFDVIAKPIFTAFQADGSIKVSFNSAYRDAGKRVAVKGHDQFEQFMEGPTKMVLFMMHDSDHLEEIISYFDDLVQSNFKNHNIQKLKKMIHDHQVLQGQQLNQDFYVTLSQMETMQGMVNKLAIHVEKFDAYFSSISNQKDVIEAMNGIASTVGSFQMGLNSLSIGLAGAYKIDSSYYGVVNTPDKLAEFVLKCIEGKIPPKYVAYNATIISSPELKGDEENVEDNPVMGQSRAVLFPRNKGIVYKIAISRWGIQANQNEYNVCKQGKGTELLNHLVQTTSTHKFAINVAERVKPLKFHGLAVSDSIQIQNALRKIGVNFKIIDTHEGNFGRDSSGRAKLLDYGWLWKTV